MPNRVTLITPPDLFENSNRSITVIDLTEEEQDNLSLALGQFPGDFDLNIYFYKGEQDVTWLFHAINVADAVYVNIDNQTSLTQLLGSYILSKSNVWYSTKDVSLKTLYSHINQKHVDTIDDFIKKVLNEN